METIVGNEVELWAESLDKKSKTAEFPIDNADSIIRMMIMSKEGDDFKELDDIISNSYKDHPDISRLLISRIGWTKKYSITPSAATLLCMSIPDTRPGIIVQYSAYLIYKCKKYNIDKIDVKLILSLFNTGTFELSDLEESWNNQKIDGNNMLDYNEYYKSLID